MKENRPSLNPVTQEAKILLKECPTSIVDFYKMYLPFWGDLIENEIRLRLKHGAYPKKERSVKDIEYYYFGIMKFLLSFSHKLMKQIPNLHYLALKMDPQAFAVDLYYKSKNGTEDPLEAICRHYNGLRAWYTALNILGYYRLAIEDEWVGKEVAKIILGDKKNANFTKLIRGTFKKLGPDYSDLCQDNPDEIASSLNLAIAQLLDKSEKEASKLSDLPLINEEIDGSLNAMVVEGIINTFSGKTRQLKDALAGQPNNPLAGQYHIVMQRAREMALVSLGFGKPEKGILEKNYTEGNREQNRKALLVQKEPLMMHTCEMEEIKDKRTEEDIENNVIISEIIQELRNQVNPTSKDILEELNKDPDVSNTQIAKNIGKDVKTVRKYRTMLTTKLVKLLSPLK
ncbi:MAG: winged helix-turn-helix domain-containing protein [Deltaproteobacteria bacterium]|nr:winged helix-turn-helix domain-containing protein [Deltaproteobacteria bacterium]